MMSRILTRVIYLPVLATIVMAALAVPASAQQQVPFKGELQGHDTDTCFSFPIACVTTNTSGNSTLLGKFSFTMDWLVNIETGADSGTARFVAANGDVIYATFDGMGTVITPDLISFVETFTITGGTGRFAGAEGSFIVERLASPVTFITSGSFDGTITSPGAAD